MDGMQRPQWAALSSMAEDLRRAMENVGRTRQEMLEVTGTAWSDDRMIRTVVGPRGQLIELEIDPRIYRRPDSSALSASILSTVRAAVEDANQKTKRIMENAMPRDIEVGLAGSGEFEQMLGSHDADLPRMFGKGDEG